MAVNLEVIMKFIQHVIPVLFASVALQCFAGEKIDQSLPANNANNVSIENLRGEVSIVGWDKSEVKVTGELDEQAERLIFEQQGSHIIIKVVVPRRRGNNWNNEGSDLTINIPKDLRVNFNGVSSDVIVENFTKNVEVKTVSGDIEAKQLSERIELVTVSGSIKSRDLSGNIRLSTVSGDINDKNSTGKIRLKVVSGDIHTTSSATEVYVNNVSGSVEFSLAEVDELVASSVSGDIEGILSLNDSGFVKLSSVSGDMEIGFQSDVSASFKMNANAGGDLINKLTSDKAQRAKYGPSSKLNFQSGNGNGSVRASTVSGTIIVK